MQLEKWIEAEVDFKTALRMYPKLLIPRLWLAELYLNTGRKSEALMRLNEIISIEPKVLNEEAASIKRDAKELLELLNAENVGAVHK